jgi:hypothetical protein
MRSRAWEPLTPRGVAAFARAPVGRLFIVQLVVALLTAGVAVWVLQEAWFPVVRTAIERLPEGGEIRGGQLTWPGENPVQLGANHFLAFGVDLTHSGRLARDAELQVEFGKNDYRVMTAPGYYVVLQYPGDSRVAFNRAELQPSWGAWEPWVTAGAGLGVAAGLPMAWLLLATLYSVPGWVIAFLENREVTFWQSWKMAGAALMPGALFLTIGMIAYGLGAVDLIELGALWALHFLIGWVYVAISPLFLPAHEKRVKGGNPFAG